MVYFRVPLFVAVAFASAALAADSGLKKLDHIVLFMQENRAFDHYFGTMAGVRGFKDPNVHISKNTGKNVFHQPVNGSIKKVSGGGHNTDYNPPKDVKELPYWYIAHEGGEWHRRSQCMLPGSNAWQQNHAAWNDGEIDQWAQVNTPYSIGYYRRQDVPVHFALAEGFTLGDSYYEGAISSTDPNRVTWFSGTINANGSTLGGNTSLGGTIIDNNRTPTCLKADDGSPFSCRPLHWKTIPEYLQDAGISWQVYQDFDNFGCDTLVQWKQYQDAARHKTELAQRAVTFPGLDKFYKDAMEGNLPAVSYIIPPTDLSEHPPYTPNDGAWFQRKVAEAVMNGKNWNSTALIISYDETGGWADHVMAPHAPKGTPGEWIEDPYNVDLGMQPTGPGFRLPFYIISPFTRGGGVFTEHTSHESQILFLEKWSAAKGKPWKSHEMNKWRREQLSDLVKAFDFDHPDYSVPHVPKVPEAQKDPITGEYNGAYVCQERYRNDVQPAIPYGKDLDVTKYVEHGFKPVRGNPTEGRYLTFEAHDYALTHGGDSLKASHKTKKHENKNQAFVLHAVSNTPKDARFRIATGAGKHAKYISEKLEFVDKDEATVFSITDRGNGQGYDVISTKSSKHLGISKDGDVSLTDEAPTFSMFSVSY